jgi:hypothetical protein
VDFYSLTKFRNGTTLAPGTYRMEVPENSSTPDVTFYKEGRAIATVKAKVVSQLTKNQATEVESVTRGNAQLVNSIRPAGWHETLLFGQARQHASPASE